MEIQKNRQVQWIDVQKPNKKDLAWLEKKFRLHPVIVDELRGPSARAHVEQYDGYLYFVYYFPLYDGKDATTVRTEIDFIVTKNSVATIHYEPLTGVLDAFEIKTAASSLQLVYGLIQHLINFEERQLRHIREKVEAIGHDMFRSEEKEILQKLTHLKRDISEYRIEAEDMQTVGYKPTAAKKSPGSSAPASASSRGSVFPFHFFLSPTTPGRCGLLVQSLPIWFSN